MKKFLTFFICLSVVVGAFSQDVNKGHALDEALPLDIVDQRSRIQADRTREEGKYQTQELACYAKFAVNDCLREVRVRRREALDKLRRQDIAINDAERKRKSLEQIERINEKSSVQRMEEESERRLEALKAQQERNERINQKTADAIKQKAGHVDDQVTQKSSVQSRPAGDITKDLKQYNEKQKEAQEHRASQLKSNQEKTGASSKSLPEVP